MKDGIAEALRRGYEIGYEEAMKDFNITEEEAVKKL